MWMTRVSINHPVFATMVMVALTVLGVFSYNRLGVEPMPDVTPPVVTVRVDYPGASPEQVENDIAKPVENAINTVAGIKMIRSVSFEGLVWTMVEFRLDVDQTRVLQEVRDKLAQIRANFPRDAKDPIVSRGDTENDQPVASFALVAEGLTQRELSNLGEQVVQKRFERVSGVGRVALGGLVTREVQVRVNPERLTAFGLSVDQVVSAVRAANVSVPVGLITNANSESIVRVDGRMTDPAAFNRIIVARKSGVPIYLSQVADVADAERERSVVLADQRQGVDRRLGVQGAGREHRRRRSARQGGCPGHDEDAAGRRPNCSSCGPAPTGSRTRSTMSRPRSSKARC